MSYIYFVLPIIAICGWNSITLCLFSKVYMKCTCTLESLQKDYYTFLLWPWWSMEQSTKSLLWVDHVSTSKHGINQMFTAHKIAFGWKRHVFIDSYILSLYWFHEYCDLHQWITVWTNGHTWGQHIADLLFSRDLSQWDKQTHFSFWSHYIPFSSVDSISICSSLSKTYSLKHLSDILTYIYIRYTFIAHFPDLEVSTWSFNNHLFLIYSYL